MINVNNISTTDRPKKKKNRKKYTNTSFLFLNKPWTKRLPSKTSFSVRTMAPEPNVP
uniref:Uncharacterized protein n=1 Tax=Arundo donax TaxID=35708 RepID=A0A0A9U7F5_ARUDO